MPKRRIRKPPKTWTGLRKQVMRGKLARQFTNWIAIRIKKEGTLTTFSLEEVMHDHNMNYESRRDYHKAVQFFDRQRKAIADAMSIFWNSSEYDKCKAEGMSEDQIFEKLMSSAVTIEIYPMWSDPQDKNKYKLFDFDSYLHLKERRAKAVVREIERTADELKLAKKGLPQLEARYKRPQLQSDGIVFELPPAPVHCPYSGCSQLFKSDAELVDHIQKTHVTSKKLFTCPVCLSGELREMEHGDFKCSECRSIIDKEQMKKYLGK